LKTAYLTDEFSTLGGLGAVAYRDPEYFREVQNQVYQQSPTRFVDSQRPSDIFESFTANKKTTTGRVISLLEQEYQLDGEFTDYVDTKIGPRWKQVVTQRFYPTLQTRLNSNSSYGASLLGNLLDTLSIIFPGFLFVENLAQKIAEDLDKIPTSSVNASLATAFASNNPQTKPATPPPNSKIALDNSTGLGADPRGVDFATGYSTLEDYWGNIPYPGMTGPLVIPATLRDSILGGLQGYLSENPLEAMYNPIGAGSITSAGLSSGNSINFSDPNGSGFVLGQIPFPNQEIGDAYSISLMGEVLNGYKTFDPKTMSNGDGIDPQFTSPFENPDSDGGLPALSRAFNTTYS